MVMGAPEGYADTLGSLPDGVDVASDLSLPLDFIHFFTSERGDLELRLPDLKAALKKDGMLWLSWPKKASKLPTDLTDNIVREVGLAHGLVDVKVAAIDENWSGLKFVYRLKDR